MNQIIYEVSNVKYLLFSAVLKQQHQIEAFTKKVEKYKGIIQSYDVDNSLWNGTSVKVSVLIPEQNALSFSNLDV